MRSLVPHITPGPRSDILECIARNPGIHLRRVERTTRLPLGQVLYHLDRLERMGLVTSHRDSGFRRYFSAHAVSREEKPILSALRHDVPRQIVLALLDRPGLTHKELLPLAKVAGSTLSFHLQRMVDAGVLQRVGEGGVRRYELVHPRLVREELVTYRGSFDDPQVDRFVDVHEVPSQVVPIRI